MSKKEEVKDDKTKKEDGKDETAKLNQESSLKNLVIKRGDYSIHVLVEQVMNLVMIKDSLPEPVVKISCSGDSKRTKNTGVKVKDFFYNEHFYFDHLGVNEEIFDSAKILIEVYDRNNTDKEDYIGVQELDYATIYAKPDHSLQNYWIALSNIYSETDFTSIKGYLKLSISILHDDDNRVELTPQDNDSGLIAVPPHIKPNYMQLSVGILKGEEFPDMDSLSEKKTNRSCQAFITMNYLGKILKTQVHDMKDNLVIWNECLNLPFTYPCTSEKIVFKVYDEDLGSNDLIGAFEINIMDILKNKYLNPVYFNVYGGPATTSGKFTDLMNENPEVGSNWKGRVLLTLKAYDTTEPKMGVEKLKVSTDLFEKYKRRNLWMIEYELIDALFLPWLDGKVTFAFAYEDNFIATPSRTVDKGNIFNWKLQRKMPFMHLANKAEELGDVFIYLCKGEETGEKKRACFQRIPASELFNSGDVLIFKLLPDPAIGAVESSKVLMKMKIKLTLQEDNTGKLEINAENNLKKLKEASKVVDKVEEVIKPAEIKVEVKQEVKPVEVKKEEVKPPVKVESSDSDDLDAAVLRKKKETDLKKQKIDEKAKPQQPQPQTSAQPQVSQVVPVKKEEPVVVKNKGHTIVANVYMSKEFIAGDKDGTSDPFVEVTLNGVTQSTSIKNDQVNAVWNESLIFKNVDFDLDDLSTWPILFFKVLDKDTFGNDDLGYSYIWLSHSAFQINNLSKFLPKWYQFKLCLSDRPQGKLLLSFYILDYMDPSFNKLSSQLANLDISPETKPYSFDINVLGLRNLEPLGILPVKKPYIYFDMNSITIPNKKCEDDVQLKSVKTEAVHVGPNPNINTTLQFKLNLPVEDVFMPTLTCMVFDKILFGIANDTLGVFSIDINAMIKETKKNLKKDLEVTSKKIGISSLTNVLGKSLTDTVRMETEIELNKERNKVNVSNEEVSLKKDTEPYIFPQENTPNAEKSGEVKESKEITEKDAKPKDEQKESKRSNEKDKDLKGNKDKMKGYTGLVDDEDNKKTDTILEVANQIIATDSSKVGSESKGLLPNKDKKKKKKEDEELMGPYVIYPEFKSLELDTDRKVKQIYLKEDTSKKPDAHNFFELGYENPNLKDKNNKKHYRRIFHSELENVKGLDVKSPFVKIPIFRDKFIDKKEFNDVFNQLRSKNKILKRYNPKDRQANVNMNDADDKLALQEDFKKVVIHSYGHFKGLINCIEEGKRQEFFNNIDLIKEKNPTLLKDFNHFTKYNELAKQILVKKNLVVRIYILELRNLAKKDLLSESDPYIKIKLGETLINEQKNHLDDQANAMIYKYYDIPLALPGESELTLEVWDYDPLFSDELIGSTSIDIEDRYYDSKWAELKDKPIETRKLYHPDLPNSQGSVLMWMELGEQNGKKTIQDWDIRLPPVNLFQMRLVVWKTRDIPMMDVEETSDVYIAAFIDPKNSQTTDTHFRCTSGEASFNWRILETIEYQPKLMNTNLNIQVYDKDLFASDDYICCASLNLKQFLQQIYDLDMPFSFTKSSFKNLEQQEELKKLVEWESETEFWLNCSRTDTDGTVTKAGSVLCSLEILPMWKADQVKVGKGRDEPNCNPFLPPPVGRITFSLNPFVLIGQLVGPRIRNKFVFFVCGILLTVFIASFLPGMLKHLIAEFSNPFNYVT